MRLQQQPMTRADWVLAIGMALPFAMFLLLLTALAVFG